MQTPDDPSSTGGFVHQEPNLHHLQQQIPDLNLHPNAKPSTSSAKTTRNQPGTQDSDADVIALSPKTLMATDRFICEICNKRFQRGQNLQLHQRGHNLPKQLKQLSNKEVIKKKVYLCPIKTCVHHDTSRAFGDLTGIKKHYIRKHGEQKWKCEKCCKKYAVHSDWKAHSKTCGTREYKCDCGTLFSRKDSFITHRAFCDALAKESARMSSLSIDINPGISRLGLRFAHDLSVMHAPGTSLFSSSSDNKQNKPLSPMSATALVQKIAQMDSYYSNSTTTPSLFPGPTMTSSSATASSSSPPTRSSSPTIQQQLTNDFNTSVSSENHNLGPHPPLSGLTISSVDK